MFEEMEEEDDEDMGEGTYTGYGGLGTGKSAER
jgi:hypothetical protein